MHPALRAFFTDHVTYVRIPFLEHQHTVSLDSVLSSYLPRSMTLSVDIRLSVMKDLLATVGIIAAEPSIYYKYKQCHRNIHLLWSL